MVTKVYVKPVGEQWGMFEFTPWQDFWDDVRRFGPRIAVHNAVWQWRHRKCAKCEEDEGD